MITAYLTCSLKIKREIDNVIHPNGIHSKIKDS